MKVLWMEVERPCVLQVEGARKRRLQILCIHHSIKVKVEEPY